MKLLLLCPHFTPDLHAATGEVMTKLVESLAERGNEIDVVSALPWYKGHAVAPEWKGRPWRTESTEWGSIIRVYPFPTKKNNIPARALGFGGFTGLVAAAAMTRGRPDVVMGMSPPIFLGDAAWLLARRWKVPMVVNTQDIFPDVAVDLGALNNPKIIGWARRHERSLYRRADAITVLSQDQSDNVTGKLSPQQSRSKVRIIENFVDPDRVQSVSKDTHYRKKHGLEGKTLVMYSGNVGLSQSFALIRGAADHWSDSPTVHFVINGEGAARPEVDRWASTMPNVTVSDFAPRRQVSDVLGSADVHLILLKSGLAKSSTPSKLYGILGSGRPVLASIDEGSEVANIISKAGCGLSVPPEDPKMFCDALEELLSDHDRLDHMGSQARRYIESCSTPQNQAEQYQQLFEDLKGQAEIVN